QYELAYLLSCQPKAERYRKESLQLLMAAAKENHAGAKYALGNWYSRGIGVRKNVNLAVEYLRSSAKQGHPLAQFELADALETGEGIRGDLIQAAKWYRRAAEQGDYDAQAELGRCYFY